MAEEISHGIISDGSMHNAAVHVAGGHHGVAHVVMDCLDVRMISHLISPRRLEKM